MPDLAAAILGHLKRVDVERERRSAEPGLNARVVALKAFQQRRFSHTYADLLASARYGAAARFFLEKLYGPDDFTRRDAQFARTVPALVRLFPDRVVATVSTLAELHASSETLDTAMGARLEYEQISGRDYVRAWQEVGRAAERERQIALTLDVATGLDELTRMPLLRSTLRLMRAPARAAGLAELQWFLETGFDTFRTMKGAQGFIALVGSRERALASVLFAADSEGIDDAASMQRALASLP
ncbi:MAG: hypothetical protein ABI460_22075 [Caldimonas sp.]